MIRYKITANIAIMGLVLAIATQAQMNYQGQLGYGLSPLGHPYDYSQFSEFLIEVANTCDGGVVYANGAWRDSYARSGLIPNLHKTVSLLQPNPYAYTDMLNFGWRSGDSLYLCVPGNNINNWSNPATKVKFLKMLINAADSLKPTYMFIGNETSHYWELDSMDYLNWVNFYHEAYDSVKYHSPTTKVGTVFNYEHLSGQGKLTGFINSYWQALNAHDNSKLDVLGISVYPFFHYTHADEIPDNYLDPLFTRIDNKPVVITETGWPADSFIGSWTCSPTQQVDYVNKLFNIIDNYHVEVVNWLFLHYLEDTTDTAANKIFRSVSLRDSLGIDRPALPVWLSMCENTSSVSIENKEDTQISFSIYPNPARTSFKIQLNTDGIYTFKMYNTLGQTVRKSVVNNTHQIIIQRDNLATGIYFCILESVTGERHVRKLLVE